MSKRNENIPGYKKTKIGWIPEDWECDRLDNVASVKTGPFGAQLHESDYVEVGTPIITVEHLSEQGIFHINLPMVSDEDKKRLSKYILEVNDIVFSRVGSVDRNSLVKQSEKGWMFSGRLLRIRGIPSKIFSPFYSHYFNRHSFKHYIRSIAVGGTMPSLNTQIVSGLKIPLPPLPEQKKIAEILSAWDRAIEQVGKLIETKQRLKKGLMQQLLTGRMRFPEFGKPVKKKGDLPEGWKEERLKNICKKTKGQKVALNDAGEGLPYIGSVSFDNSYYQFTTDKNGISCKPEDVLLLWDGEYAGKTSTGHSGIISSTVAVLRIPKEKATSVYVYNALLQEKNRIRAIREGSGIPHLPGDFLHWFKIPLPQINEQKCIAAILSACEKEIELLRIKEAALREQKKGLMQKLLTGEVRVKTNSEVTP